MRYEALRDALRPSETLLTAHHADDQLETVLMALMRGSGVDGLAAMPQCQRFGSGWHLRPLLEFTRDELSQWACEQGIVWLDDPSNDSTRFDRNYVRSEVVPALRMRWPSVAHAVSRSASHLGEAAGLLDEIAARDFAAAAIGPSLQVAALKSLNRRSTAQSFALLDSFLRCPRAIDTQTGCDSSMTCWWRRTIAHRVSNGTAWKFDVIVACCIACPQFSAEALPTRDWDWRLPLPLEAGSGVLRAEIAHGIGIKRAKLPLHIRVALRNGGERIRLAGHEHHRELKKLFQEANILPWWRDRLPLLFDGKCLVAVADLWIDASYAGRTERGGHLHSIGMDDPSSTVRPTRASSQPSSKKFSK